MYKFVEQTTIFCLDFYIFAKIRKQGERTFQGSGFSNLTMKHL